MPTATQRAAAQEVQSQAGPSSASNPRKRAAAAAATAAAESSAASSFVYNPRQDVADRRKVRSDYRALIAQAEESKRDSSLKPADLVEFIAKVDELHERVVAPSESILDTKTLTSMSEMGARLAKKMKLNADAFDTHEFVTRLARFLGGEAAPARRTGGGQEDEEEDDEDAADIDRWQWSKLGRLCATLSKRAVTMDFLLGPLEIVPKQRKVVAQRRHEDAPAERTAPRALQQHDLQDSAGRESTGAIKKVAELLAHQGPAGICLFRFAVDPHSFVNTVENFFHVSFLIKENKASLKTDADGNAILAIASPPTEQEEEGEAEGEGDEAQADADVDAVGKSKQFIMEIDYPTYLESIELYGIRESVIPTRANRVDALAGTVALERARTRARRG